MVEAFKSVALDLCKILAKYQEAVKKTGEVDRQALPYKEIKDLTAAGWDKWIKDVEEWNTKQQLPMSVLSKAHDVFIRSFQEAHRPDRLAVAQEWEKLVEEGVSRDLVRGWLNKSDGKYYPVMCKNVTKTQDQLRFTRDDTDEVIHYHYSRDVDSDGPWYFIPWMDGQTLETQRAIIRAMTPLDSSVDCV
jgi:hypothetical protein